LFSKAFRYRSKKAKFCTFVLMGYFLSNILVYGILFALLVMGYNAIREMKNKKEE